jgi:deoxyribonuclease-4
MVLSNFRFGTVGSPHSTPKKPGGSIGAVQRLHSLGLSALELGWVQSVRVSPETCQVIKNEAENQDVAISVHAPYYINLNADGNEWPKSRKRLMDAAYYGSLAGATDIIFHPGSYFSLPADSVLQVAIPRLRECQEELISRGIMVRLRPETMGKSAMLGSLNDTIEMSKHVKGVLPCLDFAHLHARQGDGSFNTYDEWMHVLDLYEHILGNDALVTLHIHLSGIEFGPKGEKNHLPIKESGLDISAVFKALLASHASGRILCESPILEEDAIYMRDLWGAITG